MLLVASVISIVCIGTIHHWVCWYGMVWYGILEFNLPLDRVYVISETGALSSDVHLSFSGNMSQVSK